MCTNNGNDPCCRCAYEYTCRVISTQTGCVIYFNDCNRTVSTCKAAAAR